MSKTRAEKGQFFDQVKTSWNIFYKQLVMFHLMFQSDIDRGFLMYAHDDSDTIEDSFDITVYLEGDRSEVYGDGRGQTGDLLLCKATINITILPKNDRPFRLVSMNLKAQKMGQNMGSQLGTIEMIILSQHF